MSAKQKGTIFNLKQTQKQINFISATQYGNRIKAVAG